MVVPYRTQPLPKREPQQVLNWGYRQGKIWFRNMENSLQALNPKS